MSQGKHYGPVKVYHLFTLQNIQYTFQKKSLAFETPFCVKDVYRFPLYFPPRQIEMEALFCVQHIPPKFCCNEGPEERKKSSFPLLNSRPSFLLSLPFHCALPQSFPAELKSPCL